MDTNKDHFNYIFWFCAFTEAVGLAFLAALVWLPIPKENQGNSSILIGFLTATVIGIPLTYLLGGNVPNKKTDQPSGTTTADISATVTTSNETKN